MVMNWLMVGCVLIACMVVIGGITRLTESGLSITEWKPISGAIPPMNEVAWQAEFDSYKRIPEYSLMNADMDLAGFKRIYFWEYLHRNWGRLMGLAFIVPFVVFWRKGLLKGWLFQRSIAILVGGGLVGALGWFMVASGLDQNPDVSHYRLAIHLVAAFSVFGLVLWTWFDLRSEPRSFASDRSSQGSHARMILVLAVLQIIWGAFTAGLDAGRIYNTWPLMNGEYMPENVTAFGSLLKDFTDHKDGVQFIHRNLAWLVAFTSLAFAIRYRKEPDLRASAKVLALVVLVQFVLGVTTLLTQVEIALGVMHQLGALVLLAVLLKVLHLTGRRLPATST